ncbi:MAG TPA: hypothetical protein VN838_08770, partial [Bradyrhizobium sp.]|nr:hypothetical protein [Bradyrhizobium sp.]
AMSAVKHSRHPEVAAPLARPSKDGGRAPVVHPSRLGMKDAEHLWMTTEWWWHPLKIGFHAHH